MSKLKNLKRRVVTIAENVPVDMSEVCWEMLGLLKVFRKILDSRYVGSVLGDGGIAGIMPEDMSGVC